MLNNYLQELKNELIRRNVEDIDNIMDFIHEMINDRMDNGESLESIIDSLQSPSQLADRFTDGETRIETDHEEIDTGIKCLEFSDISAIDIDSVSYDYELIPYEKNTVMIRYSDSGSSYLEIRQKGNRLIIEQEHDVGYAIRGFMRRGLESRKSGSSATIYLPKDIIYDIDIENVSGSIKTDDLKTKSFNIESVSGPIDISNISSYTLDCENVSGRINLDNMSINRSLDIESVSGSITLTKLRSHATDIETVSGSVEIELYGEEADYNLEISGLFRSQHTKGRTDSRLSIETVSGNIKYTFIG